LAEWINDFRVRFINNFITDNRWKYLLNGLGITLEVTFFSALIGIFIGFISCHYTINSR
jgi:ABC-type amino acid transport system permease subunit